ncbi:MAG: O-antigen ligase family protein [Phycisphaerales bacterium]|nr:O-antigen ligase family protein [Phycisphaerales bacterium]
MAVAEVDRQSFVAGGLAPQLALLDGGTRSPWEQPLYFWLGLVPFLLLAVFLGLMGQTFPAAVLVGLYLVGATFVAPQIGLYVLFAIQAWDPYFVDPARVLETYGLLTPTKAFSFIVILAFLLNRSQQRQAVVVTKRAYAACAAFILWGLLIAIFAPNPLLGVRYAAQVLVLVAVSYAATRLLRTREQVNRLMFWTIVGSLSASLAFYLLGDPSSRQRGTLGEHSNPNTTAMTLAIGMMAIPAAWGLTRRKWMWGLYPAVAAFLMYTLMRTGSRATCGGVVIAYSLGAVFTRGRGFFKKLAAAVLATAFGATLFFAVLNAHVLDEKSQERLESLVSSAPPTSTEFSRWAIWRNSLRVFTSSPLVGVGMGNASAAMGEQLHGEARDVHSNYLGALVETGVVGGLIFLGVLGLAGLAVWRIPQANPGVPATILFLYILLISVMHTSYLTKMFWLPLLLALVLCEHGRKTEALGAVPPQSAPSTGPTP